MTKVVVLGGGPGGYEAALVGAQLGAEVTVVEREGPGGACVLDDCVPSKSLIAAAEQPPRPLVEVNARIRALAVAQSNDIARRLAGEGVRLISAEGRLDGPHRVVAGGVGYDADIVLVATGATPRVAPGLVPDGDRVLDWRQIYALDSVPERLVVVGSGVTGAEFASAFQVLGSQVLLVSSRDRVLPGEDADAAAVLEDVFRRRGMDVMSRARAQSARSTGDGVEVELQDGRVVTGSHCLICVGSVPSTSGIGLEESGVRLREGGFVEVDRVSRTSVPGVYAAGDCTGVLMLASVAAMQGRIAMWHALGDAVAPLRLGTVASNVFTDPEIATVGVTQQQVESGVVNADVRMLPLATNARAKMLGIQDGFVKLFARPGVGTVLGGVVVAPRASELVLPIAVAVQNGLTVDQIAHTFAIYPSLSGSLTEAARQLHHPE